MKMKYQRICSYCNREFESTRSWYTLCSSCYLVLARKGFVQGDLFKAMEDAKIETIETAPDGNSNSFPSDP